MNTALVINDIDPYQRRRSPHWKRSHIRSGSWSRWTSSVWT